MNHNRTGAEPVQDSYCAMRSRVSRRDALKVDPEGQRGSKAGPESAVADFLLPKSDGSLSGFAEDGYAIL